MDNNMAEFTFRVKESKEIDTFNLYWTDNMVDYEFECVIVCKINAQWNIVMKVPNKKYLPRETIGSNIYRIAISLPKAARRLAAEWKLITTLPKWKVDRYLRATGYYTSC